jgi:hypothetical protein
LGRLGRRRLAAVAVSGAVALCGSRRLPPAGQALAGRVARGVLASGRPLVLGCCTGADAAALGACPPGSAVRVLAAFGPGGAGAGRHSAVSRVAAFAAAGGAVSWWAGGGSAVPLAWRLAARTRAVVQAGSGGLVAVFGAPGSRGSLLACRAAAGRVRRWSRSRWASAASCCPSSAPAPGCRRAGPASGPRRGAGSPRSEGSANE